jgi:glycine/D-amino acid oxidase-like deaminating enzyme
MVSAFSSSRKGPGQHAADVVVVGGGIAGCTVALELARLGASVVLCERAGIAAHASGWNTGTLLQQAEPEVRLMLRLSVDAYGELADGPMELCLSKKPQLLLARDQRQLELCQARADAIAAGGEEVSFVDGDGLVQFMPQLGTSIVGGYLINNAWTINPRRATAAYAYAAQEAGCDIRTGCEVIDLTVRDGAVRGVLTDTGQIDSDAVVIANGPWAPNLIGGIQIAAGRGWLLRLTALTFDIPWIIEEISWPDQEELGRGVRYPSLGELAAGTYNQPVADAFVLAPQPNGEALLGACLAPSLLEAPDRLEVPRDVASRAIALAPGLADAPIRAAWYDHRPMSADGLPIAGPIASRPGLYVHVGHGSLGMQSAPATARWLATRIAGVDGPPELAWLDPARPALGTTPAP